MTRLLAFTSLAAALVGVTVARPTSSPVRRAGGNRNVIIQMFQWSYDSIAKECQAFIGPAGYGYVQVSPAQESITGSQWWTDYQAVSYTLNNKHGTRAQYQNMVTTCHNAGVQVLADVIFNHMAGVDSGSGTSGNSFTHYNYPGTYQSQDFHYCGTPGNAIQDWNNPTQVQFCQLDNLADLATETEYVRGRLAAHANDLLSLGVDGFRIDAAKHVVNADLSDVLSRLTRKPSYITQEVYFGGGGGVQPSEYTAIGNVQAFQFAFAMKSAFESTGISSFQNLENKGWLSGSSANTFGLTTLSQSSPSNMYTLGHILMLAQPYGTPTVLSSYSFSDPNAGGPNNGAGTCSGNGETNGWLCQHRWTAITGMVGFHNQVGSAQMTTWLSPSSQRISFGRGSIGFVAINNEDSAWSNTFSTSLPAGKYCDVISGAVSSSTCSGISVTVGSNGSFTVTIPARNAIAIHTGSKL